MEVAKLLQLELFQVDFQLSLLVQSL
jgi:hypothetical protein